MHRYASDRREAIELVQQFPRKACVLFIAAALNVTIFVLAGAMLPAQA